MNKLMSKKSVTPRFMICEVPTAERRNKSGGFRSETIKSNGSLVKRYRARWSCPLDYYRDNAVISHTQHAAGLEFGKAYHRLVSGLPAQSERQLVFAPLMENPMQDEYSESAGALVETAYKVLPPDVRNTVIDVCAYETHYWNHSALEKLRKGLGRLALEWNITAMEMCERKKQ